MRVSAKTVLRAIAVGHLEAGRLRQGRGGWRIRPEAVDAWLEMRSNRRLRARPLGDVSGATAGAVVRPMREPATSH